MYAAKPRPNIRLIYVKKYVEFNFVLKLIHNNIIWKFFDNFEFHIMKY